jgi:hypothetical protein
MTWRTPVAYAVVLAVTLVWLHRVWVIFSDTGLFRVLGIDWALYSSQTLLLRAGQTAVMYDLSQLDAMLQSFARYTTDPAEPLAAGPVVYPPIFAWLNLPLTLPPPPVGFELWTLVNLLALGWLAFRTAQVLRGVPWALVFLALLVTVPVAQGLIVGQPTILLACALGECYLALREGRDLRGGLWLSVLLLKPQYALLIGPILIWKRRWSAVGGAALGCAAIVLISVALVGPEALRGFPNSAAQYGSFGGGALIAPGLMVNWRALILWLRPSIGDTSGLALALILGLLTIAPVLVVWRGRWHARSAEFPAQFSVTVLATILANYHSHVHGAVLLALPLAATLAEESTSRRSRWAILTLAFAPTLLIVVIQHWLIGMVVLRQPLETLIWSPLAQLLLVAAIASLTVDVVDLRRRAPQLTRDETSQRPAAPVQVT